VTFEEFYQLTFKNTFRFFYYRGVSFNTVDDLTSEVYIRFYQKYNHKLEQNPNALIESKKILGGIAHLVLKESYREQVKTKFSELPDDVTDQDLFQYYDGANFEADFEAKQLLLHKALASLNPTVKQVLELKYIEGKTRSQIAQALSISQDMVHTYQKRGLKYLKDKLNNNSTEVNQVSDLQVNFT